MNREESECSEKRKEYSSKKKSSTLHESEYSLHAHFLAQGKALSKDAQSTKQVKETQRQRVFLAFITHTCKVTA